MILLLEKQDYEWHSQPSKAECIARFKYLVATYNAMTMKSSGNISPFRTKRICGPNTRSNKLDVLVLIFGCEDVFDKENNLT